MYFLKYATVDGTYFHGFLIFFREQFAVYCYVHIHNIIILQQYYIIFTKHIITFLAYKTSIIIAVNAIHKWCSVFTNRINKYM